MILPRLSGPHVPDCFATGDFARQAYIVMERNSGRDAATSGSPNCRCLMTRSPASAGKIAAALADLHRQHVIHHDIKPSNIMFRAIGEAVLIDYGLSHHNQLPDLLQEEFRLPSAPRPIWRRSASSACATIRAATCFRSACCCISSPPACGRSAKPRRCAACGGGCGAIRIRRASCKADYPPWLQEIVLRCLEIEPAWRYPTAAQLAFDLGHPEQVKLTARAERLKRDPLSTVWRRRFNTDLNPPPSQGRRRGATRVEPDRRRRARYCGGPTALNEAMRVTTSGCWRRRPRRGSPASTC